MIQFEAVSVHFGRHRALDEVNLAVEAAETVLIAGPSGCGKTTLTRCVNGLIPHAVPARLTGRVLVGGTPTVSRTVAELAAEVGLLFQNPSTQLFNLTVGEEVAFGPRNLGLDSRVIEARVRQALTATRTAHLVERRLGTLSGGEQQRVAIAAVLAMQPRVLVLDEPTASLDASNRADLIATLQQINEREHTALIVVEHRLGEVSRMARRTVLMDAGRVAIDGPTADVFTHREILRRLGLRRPGEAPRDDWLALLGPAPPAPGPVIIRLEGVEAGYDGLPVLRGLNLSLHAGEFAALVGDNGAGKTTVARLLAGLVRPVKGTVSWPRSRLVPGRDVGLVFQNPLHQLFCATVDEEVRFGPENFGVTDSAGIDQALEATDLVSLRHQAVLTLSTGQQQRTTLAAALALRPQLIVLDEPTMGQDWRHLSQFMEYLTALNRSGCTILLISHDYKIVHRYAHRIMVLREGRIVAEGSPAGPFRPGEQDETHAAERS